jgi:hypothetical protein
MSVDTRKITIPAINAMSLCEAGYTFLFAFVLLAFLPFRLYRLYHVKAFRDKHSIIVDNNG